MISAAIAHATIPFASSQGGLAALMAIGLMFGYAVVLPANVMCIVVALPWSLLTSKLSALGLAFHLLIAAGSLGTAAMGAALAVSLLGAPGVGIMVGAFCTSLGSLVAGIAVAVSALVAFRREP